MTHLVPPRPNLVPPRGTTSPERPRPSSPSPTGDEVAQSRPDHHTNHPHTTPPRDEDRDDPNTRICRTCGCTNTNACQSFLTGPCTWTEPDLCSACQPSSNHMVSRP